MERSAVLDRLLAVLDRSLEGQGRFVLVSGESGVGKTALLDAFVAEAESRNPGLTVRRGRGEDFSPPPALGPVIEALPELDDWIEAQDTRSASMIMRQAQRLLARSAALLVIDDVQWADEATLDLLRYLGRRLYGPIMIIAAYRDDQVLSVHPLAELLGALAGITGSERVELAPLSREGVRHLARESASAIDVDALYERTRGNPFYVQELLSDNDRELPLTVRDAIVNRVRRLSEGGRAVLGAAAVLSQPSDLALLAAVAGRPPEAVDEAVSAGLLVANGRLLGFRHALVRLAVIESTTPSVRHQLHAAALRELARLDPTAEHRLAIHAAGAADAAAVRAYAPQAAARAARVGAHREAADLYRHALAVTASGDGDRFGLCAALAYECYLLGRVDEAHRLHQEALLLAKDDLQRGSTERALSRLAWFLDRRHEALAHAENAVRVLESVPPGPELAMAYSNRSHLAMLEFDFDAALTIGDQALRAARQFGAITAEMHALINVGTARALRGDYLGGTTALKQGLELALAADEHENAARALVNASIVAVSDRRYLEAEQHLRAGLDYCANHDLDAYADYLRSWWCFLDAERGHYDEAASTASRLLARADLPRVVRLPLVVAAAQIALRRGSESSVLEAEAAEMNRGFAGARKLIPAAVVVAEAAWVRGDPRGVLEAINMAWDAAAERSGGWELGELAWWATALGVRAAPPDPVAEPFRLMLQQDWSAAAEAWAEIGNPYFVALSEGRQPSLDAGRRAVAGLDALGASAARAAMLRDRITAGLPVPRGPWTVTREDASGLTPREREVLILLVDGLSNVQIAEALVLSRKTVSHHVSAVLAKLGEPSRARAVAAAMRRGLVPPTQ